MWKRLVGAARVALVKWQARRQARRAPTFVPREGTVIVQFDVPALKARARRTYIRARNRELQRKLQEYADTLGAGALVLLLVIAWLVAWSTQGR